MPGLAGAAGSGSLMSQRTHSVVRSMPAIEAAFSRATRREFTGLSLLGRVDDAALEEVLVLLGAGVVAIVALAVLHLVDDDAAFEAGVLDDHAQGLLDGAAGVII